MRPASAKEQELAASLLAGEKAALFADPCFSRVLVEGSKWLTNLTNELQEVVPIVDLWN